MDNSGVKIQYGNITVGAKENFVPVVNSKTSWTDLEQLQRYNLRFPNYGNPCEYGSVLLDGKTKFMPKLSDLRNSNMGWWGNYVSDENGNFSTPLTLMLTADGKYSSKGFTLTFDEYNNIYCNSLNIKWYSFNKTTQAYEIMKDENNADLSIDFSPNSAIYFCEKEVTGFERVIITFNSMNMPYNRLKLRSIDYGYGTIFKGDELQNVTVSQSISPATLEITNNAVDFRLNNKSDVIYEFKEGQPITTYFNDAIRQVSFIKSSKRVSENVYEVKSEDYMYNLSKFTFLGDVYTNKSAKELLTSIFEQTQVPYEFSSEYTDTNLSGWVPICDCREAIRQICFAACATVSTANSDKVVISKLNNNLMEYIPLTRVRQGQNFEEESQITELVLTRHDYVKTDETVEAYKAVESGTGDEIFVKFSEPLWDLSITNGEILKNEDNTLKCSANYAIIKANTSCVLTGKKYRDDKANTGAKDSSKLANLGDNIVEITDATMVGNFATGLSVVEHIYPILRKYTTTHMRIDEGYDLIKYGSAKYGTVKYGEKIFDRIIAPSDYITAETQYLGNITGRIIYEKYNLNGRKIVKEVEVI